MDRINRYPNSMKWILFVLLMVGIIPQLSQAAGYLKTQGQNMVDESG
ncbi:MAG: hypothetical protein GX455_07835, partial [Phycisphaerae bacterium]|nr:hypothetical protein [Phycisphaerae bacterium]